PPAVPRRAERDADARAAMLAGVLEEVREDRVERLLAHRDRAEPWRERQADVDPEPAVALGDRRQHRGQVGTLVAGLGDVGAGELDEAAQGGPRPLGRGGAGAA